jgi:hypothetical protein
MIAVAIVTTALAAVRREMNVTLPQVNLEPSEYSRPEVSETKAGLEHPGAADVAGNGVGKGHSGPPNERSRHAVNRARARSQQLALTASTL